MNWIKKFSKGLALVLVSLLIAVVASELIVRATQRYADVASIEVGGSNKIWDRMPSLTTSGNNHPDLEIKHTIAFNKFGARTSNETDNQVADFNVGVFGDSFTENRRIANQFTFVSMLNEHSDNGVFHNFGVDSYGLEQSFQHWLDKRDLIDMDVVLYVLCANDLRNTYEAEIFDKVKMTAGIAENHDVVYVVPLHIKFLSKIHLTYLLMEGYLKGKSLLRPERPDYTLEQYKTRFMQKRGEAKNLHDSRFHDLFADSMLSDYLSPVPSKEVLEIALHFQNTLNTWKKMVIEGGGEFYVVVLPRSQEILLSDKLIPETVNKIVLADNSAIGQLYDYPWRFVNDAHWNEYGNLSGAISLSQVLRENDKLPFLKKIDEVYISNKISEIKLYYDSQ